MVKGWDVRKLSHGCVLFTISSMDAHAAASSGQREQSAPEAASKGLQVGMSPAENAKTCSVCPHVIWENVASSI